MTEVKPATDEFVAATKADFSDQPYYDLDCFEVLSLIARIESDRAGIARLKAEIAEKDAKIRRLEERNYAEAMRDRLDYEARIRRVEVEKNAEIAALRSQLTSIGIAPYLDRLAELARRADEKDDEIARLKAKYERDMCADGHERIRYTPDEDFDPCPVCLREAKIAAFTKVCSDHEREIARLKAEVEAERSMHDSAIASRNRAWIREKALKAEVERLGECGHCGGPVDGSCCKFNEGGAR